MLLKTHKSQRKPRPIRLVCEPEWKRSPLIKTGNYTRVQTKTKTTHSNIQVHRGTESGLASWTCSGPSTADAHAVESKKRCSVGSFWSSEVTTTRMPSKHFTRHARAFLKCPYCFRLQAFLTASTAVTLHWYKTCTKVSRGCCYCVAASCCIAHAFICISPENFYANIKKNPYFLFKVL